MGRLDVQTGPRYLAVRRAVERWIRQGQFPEGARLPSEGELARRFGCSRMTVRQAIAALAAEGLVQRRHGVGTFASRPRALRRFWTVLSFTEEMRAHGVEVQNRLLSVRRERPSEAVRRALALAPGELVYRIRRLRLVAGHPVAYHVSCIPVRICPGLDGLDLASDSLYRLVEEHYGYRFTRCERVYRPVRATAPEARLLEVPPGTPLLLVEGVAFVDAGLPADACYEVYRE
ncbi:MAG: GntR family transcriptional regulator [Armatimonadota bacterium]|nr:GntR family transcriptional regulator [Armatimonadota bacterium]MDR7594034.1 GntR family transcriptional regulator [Armatimonadota bacterium]MDR7609290.1 GntR family transcriptional regulator [Armatimonadota bacterium]MDR7615762.1 GntR family transcriptional regulator [Armatimonadota bacterium]